MPGSDRGNRRHQKMRHQTPSMPSDCHPTSSGILFEREVGITDTVGLPFVQEKSTRFAIVDQACRSGRILLGVQESSILRPDLKSMDASVGAGSANRGEWRLVKHYLTCMCG